MKLTLKNISKKIITSSYDLINFFNTLKTQYNIPTKKNLSLYKSLIRSKLENGHITILSTATCHINYLQIFQNKCLRGIMGYRKYTPINEIHENTKIKKIRQRLEYPAGRWYSNAKSNVNHQITSEIANFQHHEDDKIETIHKKLITNNNNP